MSYIGNSPSTGAFSKLDDISSQFNGVSTTFSLYVSGVAQLAGTAQNLLITLSGIVQEPLTAYTVSNATIIFSEAPLSTDKFTGVLLGNVCDVGIVSDGTVTSAKLADGVITGSKLADGSVTAAKIESSVALAGAPTAATATAGTNTTQLATTAHVFAERTNTLTLSNKTLTAPVINGFSGTGNGALTGNLAVTGALNASNSTTAATATFTNSSYNSAGVSIGFGTDAAIVIRNIAGTIPLRFLNNLTEAMTLDASGNLGIGIAPNAWFSVYRVMQLGSYGSAIAGQTNSAALSLWNNAYPDASNIEKYTTTSYAAKYRMEGGQHKWYTAPSGTAGNPITFTQAMILDESGYLTIGNVTATKTIFNARGEITLQGVASTNSSGFNFTRNDSGTLAWKISTNADNFYIFDADLSNYAYLSQNPTAWQFASDARIKRDIVDLEYGLSTVLAIQAKRYTLIASGKNDIGFIAQQLKEIVPEAVSGTGEDFSEEDTPQERAAKTLGIGKETLIPILVKAIQEQQGLILDLQSRLTAAGI